MIVSKRVAAAILSVEAVRRHADSRIVEGNDLQYWKHFQLLPTSARFDLLEKTKPWVEKYRSQLLRLNPKKVDFSQSEWWR
jgi:hypothetical protein